MLDKTNLIIKKKENTEIWWKVDLMLELIVIFKLAGIAIFYICQDFQLTHLFLLLDTLLHLFSHLSNGYGLELSFQIWRLGNF